MGTMVMLLDVAPDIELAGGMVYLLFNGKKTYACSPHVARVAVRRIERALRKLDRENVGKVAGIK